MVSVRHVYLQITVDGYIRLKGPGTTGGDHSGTNLIYENTWKEYPLVVVFLSDINMTTQGVIYARFDGTGRDGTGWDSLVLLPMHAC